MKIIQAHKSLFVVSMLFLSSMIACQLSPQTTPSDSGEPGNIPPASTNTAESNIDSPVPAQNPGICPPDNTAFPDPSELNNNLGWRYLRNPSAVSYPIQELGALLSIDTDYDYAISVYKMADHSLIFALEKFLCNDNTGLSAWEIVDAIGTRPLTQNELVSLGSNCRKNDELTMDYQFVLLDQSNNGTVYSAWSINEDKKIVEASTEGLVCFVEGG